MHDMRIMTTKCIVQNDCQKYIIMVTGITIWGKMKRFHEVRMRPATALNHWRQYDGSATKRSLIVSGKVFVF